MTQTDIDEPRILIVDDEPLIRESLFEILRIEGYDVYMASSAEDAVLKLRETKVDIVVTDLKLPKMSGIELLQIIKQRNEAIEVILMTGYGSVESAVDAMRKGAFDYIIKPINDHEIKIIITKIIEKQKILKENAELKKLVATQSRKSYGEMIGQSQEMQHVYHVIDSVASSNATILISGESGTGKGLVAKAIHAADKKRKNNPFVEISCGALTETLLESELFGHVKGAFTGAIKDKEGRFEYAKEGTIFLDEIDAFSPSLQVKLLRFLQDGLFERVGENEPRTAEARVIVASNKSLLDLVKSGDFREDLYYRINVISIHMPPLRDRKDDILSITNHYLKVYSEANAKNVLNISKEVAKIFMEYDWPGNIRELENAIEGAIIMAKTDTINKWDIPNLSKFSSDLKENNFNSENSLKKAVEQPERDHIIAILEDCHWNRNKAASKLGINRTTLYNKMRKYKIIDKK